jgi:hypothetical protein
MLAIPALLLGQEEVLGGNTKPNQTKEKCITCHPLIFLMTEERLVGGRQHL